MHPTQHFLGTKQQQRIPVAYRNYYIYGSLGIVVGTINNRCKKIGVLKVLDCPQRVSIAVVLASKAPLLTSLYGVK